MRPGYRAALMTPGDRVLFRVSGDGRSGLARGVWGDGHVVAPAEEWLDAEPGFWQDEGARRAVRARVRIDIGLLSEPVTAEELRARGLTDLEVLRMPQGANPSWVSQAQLAILDELLPRSPLIPRLVSVCRSTPADIIVGGGQLAAGAVDLPSPGVAHGHRHALGPQPADELVLVAAAGRRPPRAGRRVERDEVDVHPAPVAPAAQHLGQQVGPERPGR